MLPVANDMAAEERRDLHNGLVVLHGLSLLNSKAHNLTCLWRLHMQSTILIHPEANTASVIQPMARLTF